MKSLALWIIVIILLCTLVPAGSCLMCGALTCAGVSSVVSPSHTTPSVETPTPASRPVFEKVQFLNGCNMRADHSTASEKVGVVKPGVEYYRILDRFGSRWKKINADGGDGWVGCTPTDIEQE
jgi:hypothetical protein